MEKAIHRSTEGVQYTRSMEMASLHMVAADMHQDFEVYYLAKGTCVYFVEGRNYPLSEGALVFIPPGQIHRTESPGRHRTVVKISEALLDAFMGILPDLRFNMFHERGELITQLNDKEQKQIESILTSLEQAFEEDAQGREALIRLRAVELVAYVSCHLSASQRITALETSKYRCCQKVSHYLREHYMETVSLEQLCRIAFVSQYYLCHIFHEVTGITVMGYLEAIRIQNACQMLTDNQPSPVSKIAMECGFANLSSFNRAFRSRVGTSPTAYQKQALSMKRKHEHI